MSVLDRFRLDGKRLFITGGSRGLGREMALAIADVGADCVLVGRDEESLNRTADDIRALGREAVTIIGDIGNTTDCERVCNEVIANHGPIDILINNVGGRRKDIPTTDMPLETWQELLDLNLTSVFICTKLIGKSMLDRGEGGRIINISSINSMVATKGIGGRSYETSKAAINQFTKACAVDWAQHGITVNAICPGGFMTEPNIKWSKENPELIKRFRSQIPMGDHGQPEDLGPLAVYLASEAARYVTGATMVIDGGYTLL